MDNVIKQGYLKKSRPTVPGSNPANSFLQLFEPTRWFVFGLRNRRPYLDYYEKEQHVFTAQPINHFDLFTCTKVTYTLGRNNRNWTFCLFLQDRILELTAESREVMLSWCRTLEHTLQHFGILKNVPSEHIYSDYPVKYKPKKTFDPEFDVPPPAEPAPPIPRHNGLDRSSSVTTTEPAPLVPRQNGFNRTSMVSTEASSQPGLDVLLPEKPESEHSEPDTSEDDFVNEDFFKQKKLEAVKLSNTLKLNATGNMIDGCDLKARMSATLPNRSFGVPAENGSENPPLPIRLHRMKSEKREPEEYLYSQVDKSKNQNNSDTRDDSLINGTDQTEDVYEAAFEIRNKDDLTEKTEDRNTLVPQTDVDAEIDCDDVYEAAFPVSKETTTSISDKNNDNVKGLDTICSEKRKSGAEQEENLYSDFNTIIPSSTTDTSNSELDVVNNNITQENLYANFDKGKSELSKDSSDVADTKSNDTDPIYNNTNGVSIATSADAHESLPSHDVKSSPSKPPRRSSKNMSKKQYVNIIPINSELSTKSKQEMDPFPLTVTTKPIKENIYDFGKCTEPVKAKVSSNAINDYSNFESMRSEAKISGKSSRYDLPPPLDMKSAISSSPTSSPETPRRLIDPKMLLMKNGLKDDHVDTSSSPVTPTNDPSLNFPPVFKSIIDVTCQRQSTPSPKPRHSRPNSHSPKLRDQDHVMHRSKVKSSENNSPVRPRLQRSEKTRPHSIVVAQPAEITSEKPKRKESLYSPVLNKKWFGTQQMPGTESLTTKPEVKSSDVLLQDPLSASSKISVNTAVKGLPITNMEFPVSDMTSDTTYEVPKRPRPVSQHEPQPTFISNDIDMRASVGSSSPSHDGFQFIVPSRQDSLPDEEEEGSHEYEDATGRHGEPPIPPRRKSNILGARSQSVYVPCNINQDPANRVIVRQTSLRERQRITSAPGTVTVQPLKQSEIDILQEEQRSHGIIIKISPAACQKVALVDGFNGVWIVGWDFKHYPRLSESIHIGDEVTKINDIRVTSAHMAKKLVKSCVTEQVDLVIKRLPYAQVMAIRRRQNGERLGIQRLGGTAEITYVDPMGLSAEHGLTRQAKCVEGESQCNWWITEINNRPLNLSFKGNEIEAKLNAVGKDISIVVQPSDFIKELKRQLKKLRNFKEYMAI